MTATHQHKATLTRWNWATDRIEKWCSCGLQLADDIDEDSYGRPDLEAAYLHAAAGGRGEASYGPPLGWSVEKIGSSLDREYGQSWLIDLGYGLAVFAGVFLVVLTWLLLLT